MKEREISCSGHILFKGERGEKGREEIGERGSKKGEREKEIDEEKKGDIDTNQWHNIKVEEQRQN